MMQEAGTSIRAFRAFGCWFAPVSSVVQRGDGKRSQNPRLVAGRCRKVLKGLWLKFLGRRAI